MKHLKLQIMDNLSYDVWSCVIFSFLDIKDISKVELVNKSMFALTSHNIVWINAAKEVINPDNNLKTLKDNGFDSGTTRDEVLTEYKKTLASWKLEQKSDIKDFDMFKLPDGIVSYDMLKYYQMLFKRTCIGDSNTITGFLCSFDKKFAFQHGYNGKYEIIYTHEKCKLEVTVIDGVKQGPAIQLVDNGSKINCTFVDGVIQGPAIIIYKDGTTINFTYVDGLKHGPAIHIDTDGTKTKFNYNYGFMEGHATEFGADRKIEFEFVYCIRQGQAIEIFYDGSKIDFTYVDGVRQGPATQTYQDGSITEFIYVDGLKHGPAIQTDQDGTKTNFTYVDGNIHGHVIIHHIDGVQSEMMYARGVLHGQTRETYNNGMTIECTYVDGKIHGDVIKRFSDGTIVKGFFK